MYPVTVFNEYIYNPMQNNKLQIIIVNKFSNDISGSKINVRVLVKKYKGTKELECMSNA